MTQIHVLDSQTIDKIAAGEVVERPFSVVKELVENSIDARSNAITVELKEGGISFLRVTDNGCGIESTQIDTAFMRHATSKITSAEDLSSITSLGFRGEALSSIMAVSKVELITKTVESLTGIRYLAEGGKRVEVEEIGAPQGTTIIVRNLFFNTPVRRKFLKQPATEGGYIIELMEHIALSHPDISFKVMVNNNLKFHTSGNGDLKEVIYRIYGKEVVDALTPIQVEKKGVIIKGYLGKPVLNRSNRNFENYYINGRYVKSNLLSKAIEEGYHEYLMQHKFPFVVLHFMIDTELVDVNVHPTKMDVRFTNGQELFSFVAESIQNALGHHEMIPEDVDYTKDVSKEPIKKVAEPFELIRLAQPLPQTKPPIQCERITSPTIFEIDFDKEDTPKSDVKKADEPVALPKVKVEQLELSVDKLLSKESRREYQIMGQLFGTYWLVGFRDKLFIMDQHAAHEKVKYENFIKQFREKSIASQTLNPPIIITLSGKEEGILTEHMEEFIGLGFEIEPFGGNEYALRAVPMDLYGCNEKEMFEEVIDELSEDNFRGDFTVIEEKIASMSCKAAVKGNHMMSITEVEALLDKLLTLDNPYNCPHGRPTIISMSKYEIDKKFKRIV